MKYLESQIDPDNGTKESVTCQDPFHNNLLKKMIVILLN